MTARILFAMYICLVTISSYGMNRQNSGPIVPVPQNQVAQYPQNQQPQFQQQYPNNIPPQYYQPPPPNIINIGVTNSPTQTSGLTPPPQQQTPPPEPPKPAEPLISMQDIKTFFSDYKYFFAAASAVTAYAVIEYPIWIAQNLLNNKQSWGQWKSQLTFEELYTMPQDRLFDDIAFEIALRYVSPENLLDTSHLLKSFFDDINQEERILRRYIRIFWWLDLVWAGWFFFSTQQHIKRARKHLKRVRFVKSSVLSRIAQHTYLNLTPRGQGDSAGLFADGIRR